MANNNQQVRLPPISFLSNSIENKIESEEAQKTAEPSSNEAQSTITGKLPGLSQTGTTGSIQLPSISVPESIEPKIPSLTVSETKSPDSVKGNDSHEPISPHHHRHDSLEDKIKLAQSQLKTGGHIHVVHEPHGDHHHHKVYVHNPVPNEDSEDHTAEDTTAKSVTTPVISESTLVQNETTIADPNATKNNETTIVDPNATKSMNVSTILEQPPQPFEKRRMAIKSQQVLETAAKFPRKNLGFVIYQEYPTYNTLLRNLRNLDDTDRERLEQDEQLYLKVQEERHEFGVKQSKRIELLPSLIQNYINCTIDVCVPYSEIIDNSNVYDKRIWGTDIYTDDSDIVAILYHCGILNSQDPTKRKARRVTRKQQQEQRNDMKWDEDKSEYEFTNYSGAITPGNAENLHNVIDGVVSVEDEDATDLVVTLVILPRLNEYTGCYRNNYNSRSWTNHDGVSIAIYGVRRCRIGEGVGSASGGAGSFRKRLLNERLEIADHVRHQKDPVLPAKSDGWMSYGNV